MADLTGLERNDVAVATSEDDDKSTPSVGRNAIETVGASAISLVLSLPTTIITSRYLHPAGRGAFYLGLVTVTIATTLFGSIGIAVTHEFKRGAAERQKIVAHGLVASLVLGIAAGAVLVPINLTLTPGFPAVALMPIALPAILVTGTLTSTLVALGRIRARNLLQLAVPATTLAGVVVLVALLAKGVRGAVTAWLIAQVVVVIAGLATTVGVWRPLELRRMHLELARPIVLLGLRAGAVSVIGLLNYRIELFVLNAYRGIDAVGVYSVSVSMAELLWIIPGAVATATIALAISTSDQGAVQIIALGARTAILATAAAGAALAAVAPIGIPLLFGQRFDGAIVPLLILIPGVIAFSPGQLFAVYFSMRLGQMRIPLGVALASAALTGTLAVLIIPPLGLTGAALSTSIGYTASMMFGAMLFSRRAGVSFRDLVPTGADVAAYRTQLRGLLQR